jgi:hypothetical protein
MAEVLQVSPTELKFKFELRKNIPVILTLHNPGDERVAFKVKTTSPKTYCVRPSSGHVEPRSTVQVQIIRQAQREYPATYGDTKDKFLVQSTRVGPEAGAEITSDLFDSAKNPGLQQTKLRVALVGPPQPPSPVPEHPEGAGEEDAGGAAFKDEGGVASRGVGGGLPSGDLLAQMRDKADRAERENAELRRKLVSRGGSQSGGLSLLHLVLVALVAFLIG